MDSAHLITLYNRSRKRAAPVAKIPWDDPAFSRRMRQEHLSQEHDRASRRQNIVNKAWAALKIGGRLLIEVNGHFFVLLATK